MPRPQFPVTLTGKKDLASNTLELEFQLTNSKEFSFQAGQFVQLVFEHQGKNYKRSYSIANSPASFQATGKLHIAISFVQGGIASAFFSDISIGAQMALLGSFGVLTLPKSLAGQLVLVGTGTGIAPYRSMISDLVQLAGPSTPVTILMGGRHQSDIIYRSDFEDVAHNNPHINYHVCLSREEASNLHQGEYCGYVQQQFSQLNLSPESDIIYLCGNPNMVDDAAKELKVMQFSSKQIKREKYVYSGH